MRIVLQKVSEGLVDVVDEVSGEVDATFEPQRIGVGYVLLVGVEDEDGTKQVDWLAHKIANLRVFEDENGKMNRSIHDVLQYADVIAMCVPSTPSTHHLLNAERIAKLKTDAIVINAGRGDAIDTQALADALANGMIRGAGLDVTEPEPLPAASPLWSEPKCLITPHVAGGNHLESTERRIIAIALGNVRCYANGQSLDNRMPLKG